jgi:hypothetical protein
MDELSVDIYVDSFSCEIFHALYLLSRDGTPWRLLQRKGPGRAVLETVYLNKSPD